MLFLMIFSIINKEFTVEGKGEFVPGYQIQEGKIPTYLNYTFTNLPEEVFPADITIEMSLSRMPGTLLYSVDSNNNQMIVSITDGHTPSLDIEFSKEHVYVSMSKLCNLEYPRFTKLKLRIQMRELMYIQCNDGLMESAKYQRTGILNKDYPIPKFGNKTDKLQAYFWLVNTPAGDGVHANSDQLSGCIFKVLYKNQQLNIGAYNSGGQCPITCTSNVCNSGQCLETYNSIPICNCTSSFYNGDYCNEPLHEGNYLRKKPFQYKAIKLAFNSSLLNILNLNDTTVSIKLLSEKNNLKFLITKIRINIEIIITDRYQSNDLHLLIIVFNEKVVDLQYYLGNTSWSYIRIPIDHDLSRVIFESLRLEGNVTDISYKNDVKELRWSVIEYDNNEQKEPVQMALSRNSEKQGKGDERKEPVQMDLSNNSEKQGKEDERKEPVQMINIDDYVNLSKKVSWILALLIITLTAIIVYFILQIIITKMKYIKCVKREITNNGIKECEKGMIISFDANSGA